MNFLRASLRRLLGRRPDRLAVVSTNVQTPEMLKDEFRREHAVFVTANTVFISFNMANRTLRLATVRHHRGGLSTPGGYMHPDETVEDAAMREFHEETRIRIDATNHVSGTLPLSDAPRRARNKRVLDGAIWVLAQDVEMPQEHIDSGDGRDPHWEDVQNIWLPGQPTTRRQRLNGILTDESVIVLEMEGAENVALALSAIREHFGTTPPVQFVPESFSIDDLQAFYETIHQAEITQVRAFRNMILQSGAVVPVDVRGPGEPNVERYRWTHNPALTDQPHWNIDVRATLITSRPLNGSVASTTGFAITSPLGH